MCSMAGLVKQRPRSSYQPGASAPCPGCLIAAFRFTRAQHAAARDSCNLICPYRCSNRACNQRVSNFGVVRRRHRWSLSQPTNAACLQMAVDAQLVSTIPNWYEFPSLKRAWRYEPAPLLHPPTRLSLHLQFPKCDVAEFRVVRPRIPNSFVAFALRPRPGSK